jgi:hypothetical protein
MQKLQIKLTKLKLKLLKLKFLNYRNYQLQR